DDPNALKYFLNLTSKNYGPRSRELLAFALWCGSSKKYDTDLPWHMLAVFDHMIDGGADWREICRDPLVKPVLLEVCQQQVKLAPTAVKRGEACAELGVFAWMCGESALAASAFQESPPSFPTRARRLAVTLRLEERAVRGSVSIDLAGKQKAWQNVQQLYKEASLKEALVAAQELLKDLKGDGADLVAAQIEAIKFEQALATGEWVSLKVDPKLLNWHLHKGPWEAGEDGALVQKGRGEPAFIRYRGRVGAEFEIEGRYEVRGRKDRNGGLGTAVSYRWDEDAEHFITCLHSGDENESKAFLMEGYYRSSLNGVPVKGGAHQGKFRVVGKDGKISFYVNGEPAFVDAQPGPTDNPSEPLPLLDAGGIGFCNYKFPAGQETRIYDMRVRTSHSP
ncbi:MAG TPA: hypothetical protein VK956_05030, partial [Verrucomicrobium sp.]|nr:hypothetical protein [Verrucomicrobium sp.]